ncbi:hypothetical protein DENSPDRAFT_899391, partial [Dentipellis sp. KUC8613]
GVHLMIFSSCVRAIWLQRRRRRRKSYILLAFVSLLFAFGTIGNAFGIRIADLAWVDRPNTDNPAGYLSHQNQARPRYYFIVALLNVVASWLQDGLLIYRFLLIFAYNWWMLPLPLCIFIFSIVTGSLMLVQLGRGDLELWMGTIDYALGYWASTIATTVLLTCLIVGRLIYLRRELRHIVDAEFLHVPYLSISAMLVESASLYSFSILALAVLYARCNQAWNAIYPLVGQLQMIAPELIILRVARGEGFTRNTSFEMSVQHSPESGPPHVPESSPKPQTQPFIRISLPEGISTSGSIHIVRASSTMARATAVEEDPGTATVRLV